MRGWENFSSVTWILLILSRKGRRITSHINYQTTQIPWVITRRLGKPITHIYIYIHIYLRTPTGCHKNPIQFLVNACKLQKMWSFVTLCCVDSWCISCSETTKYKHHYEIIVVITSNNQYILVAKMFYERSAGHHSCWNSVRFICNSLLKPCQMFICKSPPSNYNTKYGTLMYFLKASHFHLPILLTSQMNTPCWIILWQLPCEKSGT